MLSDESNNEDGCPTPLLLHACPPFHSTLVFEFHLTGIPLATHANLKMETKRVMQCAISNACSDNREFARVKLDPQFDCYIICRMWNTSGQTQTLW